MNLLTRRQRGDSLLKNIIGKHTGEIIQAIGYGFLITIICAFLILFFTFDRGVVAFSIDVLQSIFIHTFSFLNKVFLNSDDSSFYRDNWAKVWAKNWLGSASYRSKFFPGISILFFLTSSLIYYVMIKIGKKESDGHLIREGELDLVKAEVLPQYISKLVSDPESDFRFTQHDLIISNSKLRIPYKVFQKSTGIVGEAGSGKTNLFLQIIPQRLKNGGKFACMDPNGEFYARVGRPEDIIISLKDIRAKKIDFLNEGLDPLTLASGLVAFHDGMTPNEKYFAGNGRDVLAALLKHAEGYEDLWRLANFDILQVKNYLDDKNDIAKVIFRKIANDSGPIWNDAVGELKKFLPSFGSHVKEREEATGEAEEAFSLSKWVLDDNDKRCIYFVETDANWESFKPLARLCCHILTYVILQRDEETTTPIDFYIDEVSSVGFLPSLPLLMDRARKYWGSLFLGFQTFAQLEEQYGPIGSDKISTGLQNLFVFTCKDPKASEYYSKAFSEIEVEKSTQSESVSERGGQTISNRIEKKRLVTPAQIQFLPERTAFVRLAGLPSTKLYWSYHNMKRIHKKSTSFSKDPASPWLGSLVFPYYRSQRDLDRSEYLDEFKSSVDDFLTQIQQRASEDDIKAAGKRCIEFLHGVSIAQDEIDGVIYGMSYGEGMLSVSKDTEKLSYSISAGGEEASEVNLQASKESHDSQQSSAATIEQSISEEDTKDPFDIFG